MQSLDAQGYPQEYAKYEGMGPDGKWFTADDLSTAYEKLISQTGYTWRYAEYIDPGADGTWRTDDDPVYMYSDEIYDDAQRVTEYAVYKAGPDGKISSDDTAFYHTKINYTTDGKIEREIYSSGMGQDGKWFTADDNNLQYSDYSYDASGRKVKESEYSKGFYDSGPGPNGQWFDSDDIPAYYYTYEYDTKGNVSKQIKNDRNAQGGYTSYTTTYTYEYDSSGRKTKISYFSGDPLPANQTGYSTYTYNADGSRAKESYSKSENNFIIYNKDEYLTTIDVPTGADTTLPTITSSMPANNATGVSLTTSYIYINFSNEIICYQSKLAINGITGLDKDKVSCWGSGLSIDLSGITLSPNIKYTLTISGLMNKTGNVMPDTSISFTTGS
jgi:hypothetical protein